MLSFGGWEVGNSKNVSFSCHVEYVESSLNHVESSPHNSASFSCHAEYVEYVECSGTYTPPKKSLVRVKNAIFGVGGRLGKPNNAFGT